MSDAELLTVTLAGYLVFLACWIRFAWWLAGVVQLEEDDEMQAVTRDSGEPR